MTSFTLVIDGHQPLTGAFEVQSELPPVVPQLYRVLHELEIGGSRRSMPEVFPFFPNHFTPLPYSWQLLWKAINPTMTNAKWRALLGYQRAFTNNNGFGMDEPRADFVNGLSLDAELPKIEALVCGGALLAGNIANGWFYPAYLDGHNIAPSAAWLNEHFWLKFTAVNIRSDGKPGYFPSGMEEAQIPLLAYMPIKIEASHVVKVDMSKPLPGPRDLL